VPGRFVLRYHGPGRAPAGDLARIERDLNVVDHAPRMLLVEGSPAAIARTLDGLPRWIAMEEAVVPVPSTRPRVRSVR
jgi:hypothetical protein